MSHISPENIPKYYTGLAVDKQGNRWWYVKGKIHSSTAPSISWHDDVLFWQYKDRYHRTIRAAMDWGNDDLEWWIHGEQLSPKTKVVLVCIL